MNGGYYVVARKHDKTYNADFVTFLLGPFASHQPGDYALNGANFKEFFADKYPGSSLDVLEVAFYQSSQLPEGRLNKEFGVPANVIVAPNGFGNAT